MSEYAIYRNDLQAIVGGLFEDPSVAADALNSRITRELNSPIGKPPLESTIWQTEAQIIQIVPFVEYQVWGFSSIKLAEII